MIAAKNSTQELLLRKYLEAFLLLGLNAGEVCSQRDAALDHLDDEGDVELVDPIRSLVVVRVEALVGELLAEHDRSPAVVQEPGVVTAILDREVVGVVRVQSDAVALDVAEIQLGENARTVAVLFVMNVKASLVVGAIADHVVLQHADHFDAVLFDFLCQGVGVAIAAPESLFFTGEVNDADRVVQGKLSESCGDLHHRHGAGAVVVGARSFLLGVPGPTGGRIEVSTDDEDLVGVLAARDGGFQVEEIPASDLVRHVANGDAEIQVELLDELASLVDALGQRVAGPERHRSAADGRRFFARELHEPVTDPACVDLGEKCFDPGVGSRDVLHVEGRGLEESGSTDFVRVELAAAGGIFAFVNGVEIIGGTVELKTVVVIFVTLVGGGVPIAESVSNNEQQDCCHDKVTHDGLLELERLFSPGLKVAGTS